MHLFNNMSQFCNQNSKCLLDCTPAVRHLGVDGRADPHLERGERDEGVRAARRPHGPRAVRPVQPQVHADGLRLQEHGVLAT